MFGIGRAIIQMKGGIRVRRSSWPKKAFVVYMPPLRLPPYNSQTDGAKVNDRTAKFIGYDTMLDSLPYFAAFTGDEQWQPGWMPTIDDLLAEDWHAITDIGV